MEVSFSAGLLLGQGFIGSTYVRMGFHPAWKFGRVVELLLDNGRATGIVDRSDELAAVRQRIASGETPIQTDHAAMPYGLRGLPPRLQPQYPGDGQNEP